MTRVVMYQKWHHLLFLHWKVNPQALRPLVPKSLEIDTFDGDAYLGIVLFTMTGIRPRYAPPMPFVSAFHEFNVRTYVRNNNGAGVWFFSLDAANRLAVHFARAKFHLPYFNAELSVTCDDCKVTYSGTRAQSSLSACIEASASIHGDIWHARAPSLDHFLIERYRLYTESSGRLESLEVDHPPYPLRRVSDVSVAESLSAAVGVDVSGEPISHFSDGVCTRIGALQRV